MFHSDSYPSKGRSLYVRAVFLACTVRKGGRKDEKELRRKQPKLDVFFSQKVKKRDYKPQLPLILSLFR